MDEKEGQYEVKIGWEGDTYDGGEWKELGNNKGDREKNVAVKLLQWVNRLRAGGGKEPSMLQSVLRIKLLMSFGIPL